MSNKPLIAIKNLSYRYGSKIIYNHLNLSITEGKIYAILGKNGVGKSTLINILMGYLQPQKGQCLIFNEASHQLSNESKQKIALLHEGFIAYDYMTIKEYERFFAPFYEKWEKQTFYDFVDLMGLSYDQTLSSLSFGQKSQVVLGALLAQNAELLILDDYSMGLDTGYRRLFIDYLKEHIIEHKKTLLITSHVMNDLVDFVDEIAIVQKGGDVHQTTMTHFCNEFKCYAYNNETIDETKIHRIESFKKQKHIFTFHTFENLKEIPCDFEEKFLGFVGKY